jgi:hypothetical protein
MLLFAVVTLLLFHGVWQSGFNRVVPTSDARPSAGAPSEIDLNLSDQRFVVWAVARNAHALLHHPARLFDAEPCHPAEGTLALSPPLITLGLLGAPLRALGADPVTTYNAVVMSIDWIAAFAMFLLVRAWTGSPAAGIAAGLLFAFHPAKIGLGFVTRPMITDTGWTVLALFFASRFAARGRWSDAIGLAAACSAQIAVSFYPLLAAAILAVPMGIWLLSHYGVRRLRPVPLATALVLIAAAAVGTLGPYLALGETLVGGRSIQVFAPWSVLMPGGYLGWPVSVLAVVAVVLPRRRVLGGIDGDPRTALLVAAVAIAALATNGNAAAQVVAAQSGAPIWAAPAFYDGLAALVPGLDAVRVPAHLASGIHLVVCILAGIGAAGVLALLPRRLAPWSELGLVAAAIALTLIALPDYRTIEIRPAEEDLAFFRTLEELQGSGPVFEAPIRLDWAGYAAMDASAQVLLTAYHHRRTSGCYTSFAPDEVVELEALAAELPAREAVERLHALGFTTVIAHRTPETRFRKAFANRLRRASREPGSPLVPLLSNARMSAYGIVDDPR